MTLGNIVGRRAFHKEGAVTRAQAELPARPRNQNPNITITTSASPYQVIAYCRCSLRRLTLSAPARGTPPGGCGLSNSMKNGATSPQLLAAAIAIGSRTNQRLRPGSSCGEKAPRDSGHRITPTKSASPVVAPADRVAGSCRPSGTKPRLTTTSPPDATRAGANTQ